jgi:hypothetical protein
LVFSAGNENTPRLLHVFEEEDAVLVRRRLLDFAATKTAGFVGVLPCTGENEEEEPARRHSKTAKEFGTTQ